MGGSQRIGYTLSLRVTRILSGGYARSLACRLSPSRSGGIRWSGCQRGSFTDTEWKWLPRRRVAYASGLATSVRLYTAIMWHSWQLHEVYNKIPSSRAPQFGTAESESGVCDKDTEIRT